MGQRTNTAIKTQLTFVQREGYGIIQHLLSDRNVCVAWFVYRIGYLAALLPVGSMHRA